VFLVKVVYAHIIQYSSAVLSALQTSLSLSRLSSFTYMYMGLQRPNYRTVKFFPGVGLGMGLEGPHVTASPFWSLWLFTTSILQFATVFTDVLGIITTGKL
jgi:hypothetical protein